MKAECIVPSRSPVRNCWCIAGTVDSWGTAARPCPSCEAAGVDWGHWKVTMNAKRGAQFAVLALSLFGCTTPGPGPVECSLDGECQAVCNGIVSAKNTPTTSAIAFDGGQCELSGLAEADGGEPSHACVCGIAGTGSQITVGRGADSCLYFGRGYDCLYLRSEFPGCNPSTSTTCDSVCSDLQERIRIDAEASHDVALHGAVCDLRVCRCVLQANTSCYVHSTAFRTYDCTLTSSEIVAQARE
jgi:hypothetical protein